MGWETSTKPGRLQKRSMLRATRGAHHNEVTTDVQLAGGVRVEYREKFVEIAVRACHDESPGDQAVAGRFHGDTAGVAGFADLAARAARELPARR